MMHVSPLAGDNADIEQTSPAGPALDPIQTYAVGLCCAAQRPPQCGRLESPAQRKVSVRRRRTMSRKPAEAHNSTKKPKRNNAPTAAPQASSTVADLQEQVSTLTRELADARKHLV